MHSTHGGAECSPSFPSAQEKRSDERGASHRVSLVRSEAESFQSRNANPDCVAVNTSIQLQDDSGPDAGQQVVRVEHAPKNLLLANFSTWQGASPVASPVPLDAACGTRPRFHTSNGAPVTANDNALPVTTAQRQPEASAPAKDRSEL